MSEQYPEPKVEKDPIPKDVSIEFLSMSPSDFYMFLVSLRNEPALSITIDWKDPDLARRLKAFLEDFSSMLVSQKRTAAIRATEQQYKQEMNVFASGVKWIKVE